MRSFECFSNLIFFFYLWKKEYLFSKGVMDVHSLPLEIRITCVRLALGSWYKALACPEKEHKDKMKGVYDFIVEGNVQADGAVLPLYWRLPPEFWEPLTLSHTEKNGYWREVWSEDHCAWNGHYGSYNYCKFKAVPFCERVRESEYQLNDLKTTSEVRITASSSTPYIEGRRVKGGQNEGYFWYHPKCRCLTCDRVRYYSEYEEDTNIFRGLLELSRKALFSMRDAERLID